MLSLEFSPFNGEVILGVVDWGFTLWKRGMTEHIFQV
jgi:hypothetical protein